MEEIHHEQSEECFVYNPLDWVPHLLLFCASESGDCYGELAQLALAFPQSHPLRYLAGDPPHLLLETQISIHQRPEPKMAK